METAFTAVRSAWRALIAQARTAKQEFQDDADEGMSFFNGPYDFLYSKSTTARGQQHFSGIKNCPAPSITMTVNKVAEGVQLFGPTLYHRNPVRRVNPRVLPEIPASLFGDPNDPQTQAMVQSVMQQMAQGQQVDQVRASLLESLLNYLPVATNLKDSMRDGIDEAIIKGMGVAWTSVYRAPGSVTKLIRTEFDTVDNLLVDPDSESIESAKWIARRCTEPVWQVEAERGLAPGSLKGNDGSGSASAGIEAFGDDFRKRDGKTNDLLVYWKIWSKMGLGGLLRGISDEVAAIDQYGRYVYMEVCETCNYPLNLPPGIWDNPQEMYRRSQWETPFWADTDAWPVSYLAFHKVPRKLWPMSHFKPAMGELKFMNWAYSFLASRMQKTSRTLVGVMKAASEDIKQKLLEGTDLELLELEAGLGNDIGKLIQFLEHPEVKGDFLKVIELIERNFEKRTGLNELLYGESAHQYRSAEEANVKQQNMNIRPDDMGNKVEDFATVIARKEALAARWHLKGQDILPIFGPVVAQFWDQYVATADVNEIVRQLEYRVEAGSTKKPNKAKEEGDANTLMTSLFPTLSSFAQSTGNVDQFNALLAYWGKALGIPVKDMLLPQPKPPQPPPPDQPKISVALKGEELGAFGLIEPIQQLFGVKPVGQVAPLPDQGQDPQQQLQHNETEHQQAQRHAQEKHNLNMKIQKEKLKQAKKGPQ